MALVTEEMIEVANRAHQKALEECNELICQSEHLEAAIQAVAPLIVKRCAEVALAYADEQDKTVRALAVHNAIMSLLKEECTHDH